ncbi:WD40-repeat-containing domain protein [Baffinella frigidus]|nr:WD40-repeat-containing domain protein [Cryptophyta sp. CCMP2293]
MAAYQTVKREAAHEDSVWGVVWTHDDKLISGSIDETVKVWKANDAAKLEETATFPGNFLGVVSLSASSDGKLCAVSSLDGRLRVLNLEDKVVQRTIDPGPVEAWTVLPPTCFI